MQQLMHVARMRRQSGAAAILGALWLGIAVACLITIDIGHVFWQKRELQKIADLAALAGAATSEAQCPANAVANAQLNGLQGSGQGSDLIKVECGNWNAQAAGGASALFVANRAPFNASKVHVTRYVPYLFLWSADGNSAREVTAQATSLQSVARVGLGIRSTLVHLGAGIINDLLGALLGVKLNVSAVGWQGLANARVSLRGMLEPLLDANVGGYEKLLDTKLSLHRVLNLMIAAVGQDANASVAVSALRDIISATAKLEDLQVRLGDILNIGNGLAGSALDVGLNAFELVNALAQVASKQNAVGLDLNLPLLGIVNANIKVKVIEPAQFSVLANPGNTPTIEVRTAQIRVFAYVESFLFDLLSGLLTSITSLLERILGGLLGFNARYPVVLEDKPFRIDVLLEVAQAHAKFKSYSCTAKSKEMLVDVSRSAAHLRLGKMGKTVADAQRNAFSSAPPTVDVLPLINIKSCPVVLLGACVGAPTDYYYGGVGIKLDLPLLVAEAKNGVLFSKQDLLEKDFQTNEGFKLIDFSGQNALIGANVGRNIIVPIKSVSQNPSVLNALAQVVGVVLDGVLTLVTGLLDPLLNALDKLLGQLGLSLNKVEVSPYLQCPGEGGVVLVK